MPEPDNQREKIDKQKQVKEMPGVRRFDFRTVKKLTQIQRIRLGALHSRFAANIMKSMESFLKCTLETSFLGLEQVQGSGFKPEEYKEVVCVTYELASKGAIYSIWPRDLAFFVIERVLGGSGEKLFMDKAFSDFERHILGRFSSELFLCFGKSFEKSNPPECVSQKIVDGMEAITEKMPYEVILLGKINLKMKNFQGAITMALPYSLAKPWIAEGEDEVTVISDKSWKDSPAGIPASLAKSPAYMIIKAEGMPIRVSEFTALQTGDCILLNHSIHDPFNVYVENKLKFKGFMGTSGRQMAVRISRKISHGKNADDKAEL